MNRYDKKGKNAGAVYISIFILLAAGIVLSSYLSYRSFEQQFRAQTEHQLSVIAKLKVNELSNWRKERLNDAETLHHNITFAELAQAYFKNPQDVPAHTQIQAWLESYQVYGYDRVRLLDTQGKTILSAPTSAPPISSVVAQHIPEVLQSKQVVMVDFYYSDTEQRIDLAVLIPILNSQSGDQVIGLVSFIIDPQTYLYPYIIEWPSDSTTAETLLIRRDGNEALFLNPLRFNPNAALTLHFPLTDTNLPAVKAVLGQTGVATGLDYRGKQVLADVRAVPDSPWFLVSKMDIAEVDAQLAARLWLTLLLAGTAILAAGASLMTVRRQQRLQFYHTQAEEAEALIVSETRYRRLFEAARDGILILDAETGVIVDANPFLIEMLGFPYEEFVGKELWELGIFKDVAANKENFLELQRKEYIRYEDLPLEISDGRKFYVEFVSNVYQVNHHKVIQCNIRDITDRVLAEEKLKEVNNDLKQAQSVAHLGNWKWNLKTSTVEWSDEMYNTFGIDKDSYSGRLGDVIKNVIHPDDLHIVLPENAAEFAGNKPREYRIIWHDGSIRHIWAKAGESILDEQGNPAFLTGIAQDVTERKQAEEALHESRAILQAAMDNSPVGIAIADALDGKLRYVNNAGLLIRGGDRQSIVDGIGIDQYVASWQMLDLDGRPLKPDEVPLARAILFGETNSREFIVRRTSDDDRIVLGNAAPIMNERGKVTAGIVIFTDITESKLADEALRESEQRLQFVLQGSQLGYWDWNIETNEVKQNERWAEILGYHLNDIEFTVKQWIDFIHPDDQAMAQQSIQDHFEGRTPLHRLEYRMRTKDGQYKWILDQAQIVKRDSNQRPIRMSGTHTDITERKQAEEKLRYSERNLAEAERIGNTGSWDYDVASDTAVWSENMFRLCDVDPATPKELVFKYFVENLVHPDDRAHILSVFQDAVSGKCPYDLEYRIVKSDGSIRNIHALAETLRDEHGNAIRLVGKVEDITERKQAETELRESEVRFRQMFENHDAIMLLIEPHSGLILNANQSAAKFYGYEKPELCAMNINEINILSPEQVAEERRKALNEERNYFVFPHRLVSGEERIVEVHSSPITFKEKQALLFSIIHDITDRKQAEDALAESEKKFRALFETMSEGIVYENHDGKIISANPAAERLLGLSFDQMQGRTSVDPLWKALHEDGSPFPGETHSLNVAAKTGKPASGEVMGIYNPKSGSYAWLSVNSTPEFLPGEKKPFRAYAVFRDITERKHIEETLEKSEKKFRLLFEEMLSGFAVHEIICDESGTPADYRFLAVNTAFEKMTGLDASNIIGKTVLEVIPETESSWIERYGKVALTGEPIQFEDFAEALGKYYEVRAYRPEHGKFVTIINDITGRKQAEKKVLTTMDDLARSNAELERFAYVASHDLQEPLRMVSSYMQLLERRYKDKLDSDALEFINFAVDGSNRMKILINDLLAYSRVGMRGEELAITNCEEMLANTLTNLQASIEESKAKITHDPLPRVMADGTQLESLFQNLIGNAIKFHGSQPLLIHVGVKKDKNDWVFSVSDNGIGIDPQYFERIFILFQRLHNRQEYSGTGIGLAISKRIVERHGGRIWIESQAEKGSTFFFTLPTKGESL